MLELLLVVAVAILVVTNVGSHTFVRRRHRGHLAAERERHAKTLTNIDRLERQLGIAQAIASPSTNDFITKVERELNIAAVPAHQRRIDISGQPVVMDDAYFERQRRERAILYDTLRPRYSASYMGIGTGGYYGPGLGRQPCVACSATGFMGGYECPTCHGIGIVTRG